MPVDPGVVSVIVPVLIGSVITLASFWDSKVSPLKLKGSILLSVATPVLVPSLSRFIKFPL